jgi:glycosyltransferase involved in cell wall biosynthesis
VSAVRIMLVAGANATTGGGERHVADLLRGLPARGFEPVLVCPEGGDLTALARELGISVRHARIDAGFSAGRVSALRAALREFDPAIVHAHGSRAALFARLADADARRRCIYTVHGIHVDKAGSRARRFALLRTERSLRRRTAHFITVAEADCDKGARLGVLDTRRTTTVHNGIPVPAPAVARGAFRAELGIDAEAPLVLCVGRFHAQKDHATLLRAWPGVVERLPGATLALVGSGELEGDLRASVIALRLSDSVRFVCPRADLGPVYADADVFALSSLWEGLPYVVLEAMNFGVPVVATGVDGLPEAVTSGIDGVLVPTAHPAALADAILGVLADPAARAEMGRAAKARIAEEFSLDLMLDRTAAVYRGLLGGVS